MNSRWQRALRYGACYQGRPHFDRQARAKPRSHDDGPDNGPFLGGLGTANFSRGLDGRFNRWQLQQGTHLGQSLDAAFMALSWREGNERQYRRLWMGEAETDIPWESRTYAALWPCVHECFEHPDLPARLLLEYHSPTLPGEPASAARPVTLFNLDIEDVKAGVDDLAVALVWPNLNGWRLMPLTSVERAGLHWPNQTHAGQINRLVEAGADQCHIAQTQHRFDRSDAWGTVMVSAESKVAGLSYQVSAKADQNETGVPYPDQPFTLAHLEQQLQRHGELPNDTASWSAHWHEPLVSAVSARFGRQTGYVSLCTRFALRADHNMIG